LRFEFRNLHYLFAYDLFATEAGQCGPIARRLFSHTIQNRLLLSPA